MPSDIIMSFVSVEMRGRDVWMLFERKGVTVKQMQIIELISEGNSGAKQKSR